MKSNYKNRIAALAVKVVGHRPAPAPPPLFVFEGEGTPPEAINLARLRGRSVVYVRFVAQGEAEVVVDHVPPYVLWSTLQDAPTTIKKFAVNLAKGEIAELLSGCWLRPEGRSEYEDRKGEI
jgi:hypothetical protein